MTEPKIEIHKVPMLDTGLGREAGFKDDAELFAVAKAEREASPEVVRRIADEIDAAWERAVLFGDAQ